MVKQFYKDRNEMIKIFWFFFKSIRVYEGVRLLATMFCLDALKSVELRKFSFNKLIFLFLNQHQLSFQAESVIIKQTWVKELRELIQQFQFGILQARSKLLRR